jgi:phage gp36-like protein
MATLYTDTATLQLALQGSDSGTGTAAALTVAQLTQAITAASNRVSVYAGGIYDSSDPEAIPPAIFADLTLDLAVYFATCMYLKQRTLDPNHPVSARYKSAMSVLQDARDGKIRLDVETVGSINSETGIIINRVPRIFTGDDSNTRINPFTGAIEADTPYSGWAPSMVGGWDQGGAEYQG